MSTVFGPTISAPDVERRVISTLQYWFETYLQNRELETGRDRGSVERPHTWKIVNEFNDKNPEDAVPFIGIISDGLADLPTSNGQGRITAKWGIGIGVVCESNTDENAQLLVKDIYCPVIRNILLQKPSLRDWATVDSVPFSNGVDWVNETYSDVAFGNAERTLWSAIVLFEVTVEGVAIRRGGPITPADPVTQPGSDWPVADSGSVVFQDLELNA